jgi:hypothetical protein
VAHGLGTGEIIGLVLALFCIPPALFFCLVAGAGLLGSAIGRSVQGLFVLILVAAIALPLLNRLGGLTGDVAVVLSIGVGIVASIVYAGTRPVRTLLSVLSVAPLAFAGAFFMDDDVAKLMGDSPAANPYQVTLEGDTPVVFVIFDELPLTSLLDASEQIDRVRYPAFARLAKTSTWYRLASTVHSNTIHAVPALLSGRLSESTSLPTGGDHPENLFNLLSGHYEMDVRESFTRLWREERDPSEAGIAQLRVLGADLVVLYLHVLLPDDLSERLPPLTHGWNRFADDLFGAPAGDGFEYGKNSLQLFRRFLDRVTPSQTPRLYYHHVNLPHRPWRFVPSGELYHPETDYGLLRNTWGDTAWWVTQGYQRHLLQLGLADRLLGELLDRLEEQGLLDRSLLVVTSDHGSSFWTGQARRNPAETEHPEDILSIPLFIKTPGQRQGRIDQRNVETIDVLPTLADQLGIEMPWATDGCSLADPECPDRAEKTIWNKAGERFVYSPRIVLRRASLERKIELFGRGGLGGLFATGVYRALVGREVDGLRVIEAPAVSAMLAPDAFELARIRPEEYSVGRIEGNLHGYPEGQKRAYVGVVVDGRFSAVVPAFARRDGSFFFSAMLSRHGRPEQIEDVEIFLVEGAGEKLKLRRITVAPAQRASGDG